MLGFLSNSWTSCIYYNNVKELNVDSKAECHQLNLAHETKLKQTTASALEARIVHKRLKLNLCVLYSPRHIMHIAYY